MRGVTFDFLVAYRLGHISTRTPHAGSDPVTLVMVGAVGVFQPALPMRGVTPWRFNQGAVEQFQPALPMRGVTCWEETVVL